MLILSLFLGLLSLWVGVGWGGGVLVLWLGLGWWVSLVGVGIMGGVFVV